MNSKTLKPLRSLFFLFAVFGVTVTTWSCRKENKSLDSDGESAIFFDVLGIDESSSLLASAQQDKKDKVQLTSYGEYEILTSVEDNILPAADSKGKKGATPLEQNVKYRIEVFKVESGNQIHVKSLDRESGQAVSPTDTIRVEYGGTYKWYAYTYNTPDPIATAPGEVEVPMGENKDFMYDSGEITVDFTSNKPIHISFKRKTARIQLEIDGRGANADEISAISITLPSGLVKTANFNLQSGTIEGTATDVSLPVLTTDDFEDVNGPYRKRSKFFHTVVTGPVASIQSNGLQIKVRNNPSLFSAALPGETISPLEVTRDLASPSKIISFSFNNTLEAGKSVLLKVDLLESGIVYRSVGGTPIEWARSNLYMHANSGDHRYRLYPDNIQTKDPATFFSFKGHIPLRLAERDNNPKDPCSLIYPAGRWKTATQQEYDVITASSGLLTNLLTNIGSILTNTPSYTQISNETPGGRYIKYTDVNAPSNSNFSAAANNIQFPFNGEHVVADLLNFVNGSLISLNLGSSYNTMSGMWTRQDLLDVPLLNTSVGAWSYHGSRSLTGRSYAVVGVGALAELDLLGINILSSNFMNVRCTRNKNWDANTTPREPVY